LKTQATKNVMLNALGGKGAERQQQQQLDGTMTPDDQDNNSVVDLTEQNL
jgi:hypothetical protein